MKPQLFLHIGLHKTGSTSLQVYLARNAAALEEHGVLYPKVALGGPGHAKLFWQLVGARRFAPGDEGWDEVLAAIDRSNAKKAVLSAEGLGTLSDDSVGRVAELTRTSPPVIIVYLRRQDELVQSVYAQRCRDGRAPSLEAFLSQQAGSPLYRFHDLLERWAAAFGTSALRVRLLERGQLIGGDLVGDFLDAIGETDVRSSLEEYPRMNESAAPDALVILRRIAEVRAERSEFDQNVFAESVGKAVALASRQVDWPDDHASVLASDEAIEFLGRFAEQNERVAREYLGREDGVLFRLQPDPDAVPASRSVDMLRPAELVGLIDRLIALYQEQGVRIPGLPAGITRIGG